jgi:hypothetical protein
VRSSAAPRRGTTTKGAAPRSRGSRRWRRVRNRYADGAFDVVTAFAVLHHVRRHGRVISEMLRVARRAIFISDTNNYGRGPHRLRTREGRAANVSSLAARELRLRRRQGLSPSGRRRNRVRLQRARRLRADRASVRRRLHLDPERVDGSTFAAHGCLAHRSWGSSAHACSPRRSRADADPALELELRTRAHLHASDRRALRRRDACSGPRDRGRLSASDRLRRRVLEREGCPRKQMTRRPLQPSDDARADGDTHLSTLAT